jgi:hypothetical protein
MPPTSSDGCRRSITWNPSRSSAPRDRVGISRIRPGEAVLGAKPGDGLAIHELPGGDAPGAHRRSADAVAGGQQGVEGVINHRGDATSSTSGSVTGSTAGPSAARGAVHAASAAECS